MRKLAHVVFCVLALTGSALAGPFLDGQAAFANRDYATALRLWQPLAEQGDTEAQLRVGYMYYLGTGVPLDRAEGVRWFRRATEQRDPSAMTALAGAYAAGRGVPADPVQAQMWFLLEAEHETAPHPLAEARRGSFAARLSPEQHAEAERLARDWDAARPPRP